MRTRDEVWHEMLEYVADAQAAAAAGDDVTVELDHDHLNDLILEIQQIPKQRGQS